MWHVGALSDSSILCCAEPIIQHGQSRPTNVSGWQVWRRSTRPGTGRALDGVGGQAAKNYLRRGWLLCVKFLWRCLRILWLLWCAHGLRLLSCEHGMGGSTSPKEKLARQHINLVLSQLTKWSHCSWRFDDLELCSRSRRGLCHVEGPKGVWSCKLLVDSLSL